MTVDAVHSPLLLGDSADCLHVLLRFHLLDDLAETLKGSYYDSMGTGEREGGKERDRGCE